jgi:hypothetical protein
MSKNKVEIGYIRTKLRDNNNKIIAYDLNLVHYDNSNYTCCESTHRLSIESMQQLVLSKQLIIVNAVTCHNGHILVRSRSVDTAWIQSLLKNVRNYMELNYGTATNLVGHCIEASEIIAHLLKTFGFRKAKTVEGWCRYDNDDYGSDRPYDEHTWVELNGVYMDVTADQFNVGMYPENKYQTILIFKGLPHGMSYLEPEWEDEDY